jgi:hypothetical protein
MGIRTQTRHIVVCDGCGVEHDDPNAMSALKARISAGIKGWDYEPAGPGRRSASDRAAIDRCPRCPISKPDKSQ